MEKETCLGGGVYAVYDGHLIWLDLREQDGSLIALEPETLEALAEFAARCSAEPGSEESP